MKKQLSKDDIQTIEAMRLMLQDLSVALKIGIRGRLAWAQVIDELLLKAERL